MAKRRKSGKRELGFVAFGWLFVVATRSVFGWEMSEQAERIVTVMILPIFALATAVFVAHDVIHAPTTETLPDDPIRPGSIDEH